MFIHLDTLSVLRGRAEQLRWLHVPVWTQPDVAPESC